MASKGSAVKVKKSKSGNEGFGNSFKNFSTFGDRQSDGTSITLKNADKWLKQAGILDGKTITNADTAITFSKISRNTKRLDQSEFEEFLETLASDKNMTKEDLMAKLEACSEPELSTVQASLSGNVAATVERLTDTSRYTGTHRERFDEEGRGRGIEGRMDVDPADGYVTGFRREKSERKGETSDDTGRREKWEEKSEKIEERREKSGGMSEKLEERREKSGGMSEKLEERREKSGGMSEKLEEKLGKWEERRENLEGKNEKLDGQSEKLEERMEKWEERREKSEGKGEQSKEEKE